MTKINVCSYNLKPDDNGDMVIEFKVNNEDCQLIIVPGDIRKMEFTTRLWAREKFLKEQANEK